MKQRKLNLTLSFIGSFILHAFLLFIIYVFNWLIYELSLPPNEIEKNITVVFPENKPEQMRIVENQNESLEKPDKTNLLSDKNSRAKNPNLTSLKSNIPLSEGNVTNEELSSLQSTSDFNKSTSKPFSREALTGKKVKDYTDTEDPKKDKENEQYENKTSPGNNQFLQQDKFSVEEVGALSLSTYAWEWAPYINKLKRKHSSVWYAPAAYSRLGIIHGQTKIIFEIARDGSLVHAEVIDHIGHESLEISSFESIKAIFPFFPLPDGFPDPTLKITATLIYPDLKKLYNERRR